MGRSLAIMTAVVFAISAVFPLVAGVSKNTAAFPKWWGRTDVAVAFVLAALSFAVVAFAQGKINERAERMSYCAYRILIHGIIAMLAAFFLLGDYVVWPNCLTGLAWRSWLLLYCLPAWFTALRDEQHA